MKNCCETNSNEVEILESQLAAAKAEIEKMCQAQLSYYEEIKRLQAEVENLRVECGNRDIQLKQAHEAIATWKKTDWNAENKRLREALEEYGEHSPSCILSMWSQGRPTADGGYETMYNGQWYRETPECECGFQAALDGQVLKSDKLGDVSRTLDGGKIVLGNAENMWAHDCSIEKCWHLPHEIDMQDTDGGKA